MAHKGIRLLVKHPRGPYKKKKKIKHKKLEQKKEQHTKQKKNTK